jgi:predicted MFS family arabinose efflux permease
VAERRRLWTQPVARDGVIAMGTSFLVLGVTIGSWASRVPSVRQAVGLGTLQLGIALLGLAGGAVVAMPFVGWLVGRLGSARLICAGVAMCAITLPLTSFSRTFTELALALFALGTSIGTVDVSINAYAVGLEQRVGRSMLSSFHAAFSVGAFLGAGVGALAAALYASPTTQFLIVAACGAGLWATGVPRRLDWAAGVLPRAPTRGSRWLRRGRPAHLPPALLLMGALAFCGLFAEGAAADWSAVYLQATVKAGATVGAATYSIFALAMTVSRLMSDDANERLGTVTVTRVGSLIAGTGLTVALLVRSPVTGVVGFMCLGAGLAPVIPNVFRAAALAEGTSPGAGIATGTTLGYMGFMLGPPLIGVVGHAVGLATALGLVVVALAVIALLAGVTRAATKTGPGSAELQLREPFVR